MDIQAVCDVLRIRLGSLSISFSPLRPLEGQIGASGSRIGASEGWMRAFAVRFGASEDEFWH